MEEEIKKKFEEAFDYYLRGYADAIEVLKGTLNSIDREKMVQDFMKDYLKD